MRLKVGWLVLGALLLLPMAVATAQSPNRWQSVNLQGLSVFSMALDPANTQRFFVGTNAGLLRSDDGGGRFVRVLGGLPPNQIVMQVRIDPNDQSIVYAATPGAGLFRSADGGSNWRRVAGIPQVPLGSITLDPADPNRVFVATFGAGVFRSTDAGQTYESINQGLPSSPTARTARPLLIDPLKGQTLYLGTDGAGVFRSDDGGDTWQATGSRIGSRAVPLLLFDPTHPARLLAGTDRDGVFVTEDRGESWSRVLGAFRAYFVVGGLWSERDPQRVLLGSRGNERGLGSGVLLSRDGGKTFAALNEGLSNRVIHSLSFDPQDPNVVYAGSEDGLFRLTLSSP